ncbi:Hypothetical predicted protein [Lecanosticta acicola]|uniref:Uncharacterized protein n=1 Tax=Lecanosticta acicola TaxID=111012 RepID=A0AAI8YTG7_9PEZI|nr:Hypothetical predicted protein [Lecanosticta acicola]
MPATPDASKDQQATAPKWIPNKDERDDLNAIDAAIGLMRKSTPTDPYVLTIPQNVEPRYHHYNRVHAEAYANNTPFERTEHENLQYMTFHFHEHGKDIYVLKNSRPAGDAAVNGNPKSRPGTGTNTPSGGPKKTISFSAYKNKQNGVAATAGKGETRASDAPSKQGAVKGPIERVKAESEEMLAAVAESEGAPAAKRQGEEAAGQQKDLKRKRDEQQQDKSQKKGSDKSSEKDSRPAQSQPNESATNGTEPPAKKAKVAADKPTKQECVANEKASQSSEKTLEKEHSPESGMPPRLSPGMPPRLSPGMPDKLSPLHKSHQSMSADHEEMETPSLPVRLSPTLPDNIAKTLEARSQFKTSPRLSASSAPTTVSKDKDGKLTPMKKLDGITKHKSPVPRNGFRATSSSPAVRSDAEAGRAATAASRAKSPEQAFAGESITTKAPSGPKPHSQAKEALMVKLKFKKSKKLDLRRMLATRPVPDRTWSDQANTERSVEEPRVPAKTAEKRNGERQDAAPIKGVAQKVGAGRAKKQQPKQDDAPLAAQKRAAPQEEDAESPPAKRKKTETSEARQAPSTPAPRELDSPLAQKSTLQATPVARKDVLSAAMKREQSQDSNATHGTPPAVSSTPTVNGSSAPPNGIPRGPSSQPSNKTPRQQAWEAEQKRLEGLGRELKHAATAHLNAGNEQKLAAIKCLESFLCYLLAFTCADEAAIAADPKQTPANKTWRSLQGFYGFVKRNTEAYAPLCGLACSLGMVFNAHVLALLTQFPGEGASNQSLLETQAHMQRAAGEADTKLDIDILQETFPKAWSGRTKALQPKEKVLEPGKFSGPYKFPLQVTTSPIRAARAGYAILQEWIAKEKIDYTPKLKL